MNKSDCINSLHAQQICILCLFAQNKFEMSLLHKFFFFLGYKYKEINTADGVLAPLQIFVLAGRINRLYSVSHLRYQRQKMEERSFYLGYRTKLPSGLECENTCKHESCNPVARCLFCSDKLLGFDRLYYQNRDFFSTRTLELRSPYSIFVNLGFTWSNSNRAPAQLLTSFSNSYLFFW